MDLKQKVLSTSFQFGSEKTFGYSVDLRALLLDEHSEYFEEIIEKIWTHIKAWDPEIFVGKGVGSFPLLIGLKLRAHADGKKIPVLSVRDARKNRGNFKKIVEGPTPENLAGKSRAVFIDDIFQKGNTYKSTVKTCFEEGFNLTFVGIAVIFDFWDSSRQYVAKKFPFYSIFKRHDLGLTRKDDNLPTLLDKLSWRLHTYHRGPNFMPIKSLPVIHDARLFLGNDNTAFYCFDVQSGNLLWSHESRLPTVKGTACVANFFEDNVFYTSYDGTVRSINYKTGKLNWAVKADLNLHSSIEIDKERRQLFLGTEWDKQDTSYGRGDYVSLCLDTGYEIWRTKTRGMIPASPTYCEKYDLIICGNNDFNIYVLDPDDGTIINKLPTKGEVKGKPALSHNQKIAVCQTVTGHVYAFKPTGKLLWERKVCKDAIFPHPLIWDDTVYVTSTINIIFALDLYTGFIKWVCNLRGFTGWGVIRVGNHILSLTHNGFVVLIDRFTGKKISSDHLTKKYNLDGILCYQPPAFDGENLIIVTNNKGILSFKVNPNVFD